MSSSSLSNAIVSSPPRIRVASRSVLATNSCRLSCRLSARWSFSPAPFGLPTLGLLDTFASPFPFTVLGAAVPLPLGCTPLVRGWGLLMVKEPSRMPSKSSGVGGARERHMSAMERRLRMSAW